MSLLQEKCVISFKSQRRVMSPAHLSPVVFKHHEAGLRVGSTGAGGGGVPAGPTPRTPWVQPAQPAHTGPSGRQVRNHKDSKKREGVPAKGQSISESREKSRGKKKKKMMWVEV